MLIPLLNRALWLCCYILCTRSIYSLNVLFRSTQCTTKYILHDLTLKGLPHRNLTHVASLSLHKYLPNLIILNNTNTTASKPNNIAAPPFSPSFSLAPLDFAYWPPRRNLTNSFQITFHLSLRVTRSETKRAHSREFPSAATYGTSQQKYIWLSIDFR